MMTLQEAPCAVYTVKKINGSRDLKRRMENMGIAAGADVEVIEHTETVCRIKTVKREIELSVEEAACISVGEQFKRNGDPVLFSCCSYGRAGDLWDRANEINENVQQKGDERP